MADNIQYKSPAKRVGETYIPRRGDLITFVDFNDAIGMIVDSSYFINQNAQGMVKYKFVFPDTKPFQFAREIGGARDLFQANHLMMVYNKPFANNLDIIICLIDLKETLDKKKWKVHHRKTK